MMKSRNIDKDFKEMKKKVTGEKNAIGKKSEKISVH